MLRAMKGTVILSPLAFAPPFGPPQLKSLGADDAQRLSRWFDELLPGERLSFVEWVGTDPRQPLHAVVASFVTTRRPPIVIFHKLEELERRHVVEALSARDPSATPVAGQPQSRASSVTSSIIGFSRAAPVSVQRRHQGTRA